MKKLYTIAIALFLTLTVDAQNIIYSNNFESGVGAATIVGNGAIETVTTPGFGHVFHNAVTGEAVRTNYLLLSDTIFTALQRSKSYKLSIGFWVNKSTATGYYFTPLFSAYGAAPNPGNTWPMMVLQSRLLAQVNCAGWTDLTNADNVLGTNKESTDWMIKTDSVWHYYTATFDTLKVKVYIDGVVQNEWNCNGTNGHTVKGLFTNGSDLKYICLGGNQAWTWNDVDAAYCFDDVAIYSDVLTPTQINAIITAKTAKLKQNVTFASLNPMNISSPDQTPVVTTPASDATITFTSSDPTVATIVAGKIHPVSLGTSTITASFTGSAQYRDTTATQIITISDLTANTVTFDAVSQKVYGDAPFTVTAHGLGTGAITYSIVSGPATISGAEVTITGAGSIVVKASQAQDATYALGESTKTIDVAKASASVTLSGLTPTYDATAKSVTATTVPAGKTVNITYAGSATAPVNAGTYAITATIDDANYSGTASGDLIIAKAELTVTTEAATRMKGLANPAFVLKYTGFKGTDSKTSITTEPTATCDATITSATGDYPVVVSGGVAANYTFTYVNGTLTVTVNTAVSALPDKEVEVYPNPVADVLIINNNSNGYMGIKVLAIDGAIMKSLNTSETTVNINVRNYPAGVYLVKVSTNNGLIIKQIIKNE
jgi:hypothetical protein